MSGATVSKALFIDVEVDEKVARDPEVARKLAEVCPVDIFAQAEGGSMRSAFEAVAALTWPPSTRGAP